VIPVLAGVAVFAPLAALAAFAIMYEEYSHHFPERGRAFRLALRRAIVVLLIFVGLGLGLALVLPRILS
jgi:hypothetical protein